MLQICSWDDWTLSLITSHLSLCFQIIFFLKKKEKYYTVADDGEVEGPGKHLWLGSVVIKSSTVQILPVLISTRDLHDLRSLRLPLDNYPTKILASRHQ